MVDVMEYRQSRQRRALLQETTSEMSWPSAQESTARTLKNYTNPGLFVHTSRNLIQLHAYDLTTGILINSSTNTTAPILT